MDDRLANVSDGEGSGDKSEEEEAPPAPVAAPPPPPPPPAEPEVEEESETEDTTGNGGDLLYMIYYYSRYNVSMLKRYKISSSIFHRVFNHHVMFYIFIRTGRCCLSESIAI